MKFSAKKENKARVARLLALMMLVSLMAASSVAAPSVLALDDDYYRVTLDNFESYANSSALSSAYTRNSSGGQNTMTLIESPFGFGNAMQFDYTFNSGYSGRYRAVSGNWPGIAGIELWIQGDANGQDILLQLGDGSSYEAHLNDLDGFDKTSTAPQHLIIPIAEFKPKSGSGTLNVTRISSYALYVNQISGSGVTGGSVILDEINLLFYEEPVVPKLILDTKEMTASGNDNLITVLRANSTVTLGGKLVQVSYEADNDNILMQTTRLVPKGPFKAEGTVNVTLKKAKLFVDNAAVTVDVNETVTIHVSDLSEPVDIVDYLLSITGQGKMLTSMQFCDLDYRYPDVLHEQVADDYGVYPAFYGTDFHTGSSRVQYRNIMVEECIYQWEQGSIPHIMFHISPPQFTVAQEANGNWGGDTWNERRSQPNRVYSFLYKWDWEELMTDGTPLNTNWKLRMDEYAKFLKQLEDAGVTVVLRPFHEMQQHVFWWGGRPGLEGTAGLWRMFHDYMEITHGLTNIIWDWNVQDLPDNYGYWTDTELGIVGDSKFEGYKGVEGGLEMYEANDWNLFNPGADYYDILSVDFYDAEGYSYRRYEQAVRIAEQDGGKPIWIGETFTNLPAAKFVEQPDWTLCMLWGPRAFQRSNNPNVAELSAFFQNNINIEETPRFSLRHNGFYRMSLDDYESYNQSRLNSAYTRNSTGGQNSVTLLTSSTSPFDFGNAMQFDYTTFRSGFTSRSRSVTGIWPDMAGIELWFQGDGGGHDVALQLGDGATIFEAFLKNIHDFDPMSTEPQHLTIPIEEFKPQSGAAILNTAHIKSFGVCVYEVAGVSGSTGRVRLDEVNVLLNKEPFVPSVKFNKTNMTASGNDNLITVLRENSTIPLGGKIVQVSYEADNYDILMETDRLVPKGPFNAEGKVNVTIKKAKLYLEDADATVTVDVNQTVTIEVSDLAEGIDIVDYLLSITGQGKMVTSMQFCDLDYRYPDVLHEQVADDYGVYPAFYGTDFHTGSSRVQYRNIMVEECIYQWEQGSIPHIMFHISPPQFTVAQEANGNWGGDTWNERRSQPNHVYSFLYKWDWEELMTDGTPLNTNWKLRMDEYAKFLKQLEDAGVTVILRPFHEMQQHVFWWGGRPGLEGTAGLWRMFHDYMEINHGLTNIIWDWNVQDLPDNYGYWTDTELGIVGDSKFEGYKGVEGGLEMYEANDWNLFNPGADYYDILSVDFYDAEGYSYRRYEQAVRIAEQDGGKPIWIGETFTNLPAASFEEQPDWTLCMLWGPRAFQSNNNPNVAELSGFFQNNINIEATPRFKLRVNEVKFKLASGQAPSFVIRKNMITQLKMDTHIKGLTFTSSNPNIVTVTQTGVVTGKSIGVAVVQIKEPFSGRVINVVVNCTN